MDQSELHAVEAHCTQEAMPRCRAACPLQMDVRAFMEHLAAGRARDARKLLERHLPLPAILIAVCDHPCENACLRRDLGGALAVGALERHVLATTPPQTRLIPRPPRQQRLAVLGAGLAGLVVAWELSRKGFPVDVLHEGDARDALRRSYPDIPETALDAEWTDFGKTPVTFLPSQYDATLLGRLRQEYAAVFVDMDAAAALLPLQRNDVDAATLHVEGNVCCGGWTDETPTGARLASASRQAGEGRTAAITLFRLMTGASLAASREQENDRRVLHTPLDGVPSVARVLPAAAAYDADEAAREAGRCLRCECLQCVRECAFLERHKEFPRTYARKIYNNAAIVKGTHTANALALGCALCGQCTEICPEGFSMADLCLHARQDMVERGYMPQSAHEFALEDMAQASGPESSVSRPDPATGRCARLFFPGCQLAAARGPQVLRVWRFLRERLDGGVGIMLSCCGVPAFWAGNTPLFDEHAARLRADWESLGKPELIVACASCLDALARALPDARLRSLWEYLDELLPEAAPAADAPVVSIQDPCGARHQEGWRAAVRSLVRKCGLRGEDPRRSGTETACCGYGGLVWNAQPDMADVMAARRASDLPHTALCSCIMCRDRLARQGKESLHLLDLLPMTAETSAAGAASRAPVAGLSARRAGREALRREVLAEYGETLPPPEAASLPLLIADDVLARMEDRFILRQDVQEAVEGIERTGQKFLEKESGHFVGSWRPRHVTFWVEYAISDEGCVIYDAWCHRMWLPGAMQPGKEI